MRSSGNDPETLYGLLWRIVRIATTSYPNLIRVCVLICLVGGILWLIASVVRLDTADPMPRACN